MCEASALQLNTRHQAEELLALCEKKKMTVATAESCSGGLIGAALTAVPGSSAVYLGGVISYANEVKEQVLGVSHKTLLSHGAVSEKTACEMACGARHITGADFAVSVTGIAGPGGGTAEKPVGLVYIGVSTPYGVHAYAHHFAGDRAQVRAQTVSAALMRLTQSVEKA